MPEMTMAEMKADIEQRGALEGAEVLARLHPVAPENRPFFIDHTLAYEDRSFVVRRARLGSHSPDPRSQASHARGARGRRERGASGGALLQMASARVDKLIPAMKEALGKFAAVSCGPNSRTFPEWAKICWADFLRSFGFSFKRMAAAPPQVPKTLTRGYGLCALHFSKDTLWYENAQGEWKRLAEDYANPRRVFERVMRSRRAQAAATGRNVPMDPYEDAEGVRTSASD